MKRETPGPLPLVWPSGGFQWKPELRRQLPAVRGVHAPPPEQPAAAAPPLRGTLAFMGASGPLGCFANHDWQYWATGKTDLPGEHLARAVEATRGEPAWLELLAQAAGSEIADFWVTSRWRGIDEAMKQRAKSGYASALDWAMHQSLARNGVPVTLRLALELWRRSERSADSGREAWYRELLGPLRQAIAAAPGPVHDEALGIANEARRGGPDQLRVCAHLFPHRGEWAHEWLALNPSGDGEMLLAGCVLAPDAFRQYLEQHPQAMSSTQAARDVTEAALLLQIQLHGDAAFPVLALLMDRAAARDESAEMTGVLGLLTRMHVPALVPLLVRHLALRKVRVALERLAKQFPAAVLVAAIEHTLAGRSRAAEGWTIRLALQHDAALPAALAALEPASKRARLESLLAALQREPAPPESLPPLLREPPWLRADRPSALPAFEVPVVPTPERVIWQPGEHEAAEAQAARDWREAARDWNYADQAEAFDATGFPRALHLLPQGAARLLAGEPLQPGDVGPEATAAVDCVRVLQAPPHCQVVLWNSYPPGWTVGSYLGFLPLLARHGVALMPGMVRLLTAFPGKSPGLAMRIDAADLVPHMLHVLRNVRLHRHTAAAWLLAFPGTACTRALPLAFAPAPSPARDDARHGIRWLVAQGQGDAARAAAEAYGGAMPAALQALLRSDPLDAVPDELPPLPAFFEPHAFRRPELRAGGVLPVAAMEHIARMLSFGLPEAPYAGIAVLKEACTATSLAEFAWDLYEAWMAADAPASGRWAFGALAQLGDAETAARLATRVRQWAGEAGMRGRAADGLDLLRAMGSDAALLRIHAIASKGAHKRTREHAWAIIHAIARDRGLGMAELEDRLAPTLGLEEPDAATLDFGPRRFTVGFDEGLRPTLHDALGRRLKDLPKPGKDDDSALAEEAVERWKLLRKEAKALGSLQVTRLERAMVDRRRWDAGEFQRLFVEHPVMRHLATRLAWGRYVDGRLVQAFRVADDRTLANLDDELHVLPEDAFVGIPHPLEFDDSQRAALLRLQADYEILQPFKQLARETYAVTAEEAALGKLARFRGRSVATGALQGLDQKGWTRGSPQDGGMIVSWERAGPDGLGVGIGFSPGIFVAGRVHEPRQSLDDLWISRPATTPDASPPTFGQLDPIFLSEILRDIDLLNPALATPTP